MGKILIIDGSRFRQDLITIIETYNNEKLENKVTYEILPNESIKTQDEIKKFIRNVRKEEYDVIFCHLRWIDDNIEQLEKLINADWFAPILTIENRIGVSNGSEFRDRARDLGLFLYLYSHERAKGALAEFLYE